jgi:hypothetical protein
MGGYRTIDVVKRRRSMWFVRVGLPILAVALAALTITQLPDIMRYMKMRSM